jgi:L-threonylcarbamoyladenylate synthase
MSSWGKDASEDVNKHNPNNLGRRWDSILFSWDFCNALNLRRNARWPMATIHNVKTSNPEAISQAADLIRGGGLVAFPTETVYGLGADAANPLAVARIFEVKQRPSIDPLIVHVADPDSARLYGDFPEPVASSLMARFWPGPLTLVVPKKNLIPPIVTAGLDTIAIRIPDHPCALALIRAAARPIAAPSANLFGYVSPTAAEHVAEQLGDSVDLILDGGPCPIGLESTIVSLVGPTPCILRYGGIPVEEIESAVGAILKETDSGRIPQAPGQMDRHYATRTPLEVAAAGEAGIKISEGEKVGLLAWTRPLETKRYDVVEVLSPDGNLREAAANLFAALRRLDTYGLDRIIALPTPETGLGIAIMDRLRRCSARNPVLTSGGLPGTDFHCRQSNKTISES